MYKYIVIGCSAGSALLIKSILSNIPKDFIIPMIFLRHIGSHYHSRKYAEILAEEFGLNIKEAEDKEKIEQSSIYLAPPGYHLLIEESGTFSLSLDEKVNFNRPSIDVFFESVAYAFGSKVIGIILSGANCDGAIGLKEIKLSGGTTIVQEPSTAEFPMMPQSAINKTEVDYICKIEKINSLILEFNNIKQEEYL